MHFSLAKNLNRKGTESALGFAALAQAGIAVAVLLSLAFVGTEAARTPGTALVLNVIATKPESTARRTLLECATLCAFLPAPGVACAAKGAMPAWMMRTWKT